MKFLCFILSMSLSVFAKDFYDIPEADSYQPYYYEVRDHLGGDHKIAAHLWSNQNTKLIFMVHGYVDNCGQIKPLERWFIKEGFDVLCLELPGHGNSSGKRADIASIEVYAHLYREILPQVFALKYDSISFYGHSTGNLGMIDYLLDQREHQFDKIIMATPLIRSYLWDLSRFGYKLSYWFLKKYPRRPFFIRDPEYKELKKLDPHPISTVPAHWFYQLMVWNEALLKDTRTSEGPVHVIFAAEDTVIDFEFNKKFIEERFPNSTISVINDSDHLLHFQKDGVKKKFYEILKRTLK